MIRKLKKLPPAPENIHVVYPDGTTQSCEIFYNGLNDKDLHEWVVTTALPMANGAKIRMDTLPARTTVTIRIVRSYNMHQIAQVIRDHRLQPRIRSESGPPEENFECLCKMFFFGVAEWSYHVADRILTVVKES